MENRGNLQVSPEQLDAFARECRLLEDNVDYLSERTIGDSDRILHYLATMKEAVRRAEAVGGGIIVW